MTKVPKCLSGLKFWPKLFKSNWNFFIKITQILNQDPLLATSIVSIKHKLKLERTKITLKLNRQVTWPLAC